MDMSVDTFIAIIQILLPEPHAGLLAGILFGTKATLSRALTDALVTTGTFHIVALSGANISILTGLVDTTLLHIVSRRIASLLTIIIIIGFILFVGPSPSVVRAGIMGSITLFAVSTGRQRWSLYGWCMAVVLVALFQRHWLLGLSFQLSAGATLGIILFGSALPAARQPHGHPQGAPPAAGLPGSRHPIVAFVGHMLAEELRLTLAAQVFTIPLILFVFQRISLIAPISNILIAPVIPLLTAVGLMTVLAGWVWVPLGYPFAWACWVGLTYVMGVVHITSRIPFASIGW